MPKGYIVARVDVTDWEHYARYARLATIAIARYGGRVLVRGGKQRLLEGSARARNVVIEFDSLDQAIRYYNSSEYEEARRAREGAAVADFVAVEGGE